MIKEHQKSTDLPCTTKRDRVITHGSQCRTNVTSDTGQRTSSSAVIRACAPTDGFQDLCKEVYHRRRGMRLNGRTIGSELAMR
jgi:hypothetical protein